MSKRSTLDFHRGNVLLHLASTYPTLMLAVNEAVQNALDSMAQSIRIVIDMRPRKRIISVMDDGDGVTQPYFEKALMSVGKSVKKADKLGRFGLGLIAFLGKCKYFTFTSRAKREASGPYREWTFDTDAIQKQSGSIHLPLVEHTDWFFSRKLKTSSKTQYVPWRSQMKVVGFTDDAEISRLDPVGLSNEILHRYNLVILRRNVNITIHFISQDGTVSDHQVEPRQFTGEKLKVETYSSGKVTTTMSLYLSPRTAKGRYGQVLFGEAGDDFRLSAKQVLLNAQQHLPKEVCKGLRSGVFEGEIVGRGISLAASRRDFQYNDAYIDYLVCIETWWTQIGSKIMDEIQHAERDSMYQRVGLRAMNVIVNMLRSPDFEHLLRRLKMVVGSIGTGHHEYEDAAERTEPRRRKSVDGGAGKPREKTESGVGPTPTPESEKPRHVPGTVAGPSGKKRKIVRGDSVGIHFDYAEMPMNPEPFVFDERSGVITFNTRHKFFRKCENTSETTLAHYNEYAAIEAIALVTSPAEQQAQQRVTMLLRLEMMVFKLTTGDVLAGRRRSTRKPFLKPDVQEAAVTQKNVI